MTKQGVRVLASVVEGRAKFNRCVQIARNGDVRPLRAYVKEYTITRAEVGALVGLINNLLQHGKAGRDKGSKSTKVRVDVNQALHAAAHEAYLAKYSAGTTLKDALPFIHKALERHGMNTDANVDRATELVAHPSRIHVPKNNT